MSTIRPKGLFTLASLCLVAILVACNQAGPPPEDENTSHYRYVSLDQLPSGFSVFGPVVISDSGQIYGILTNDAGLYHVAVYADGAVTALQPGYVYTANEGGTIGGSVIVDPEKDIQQAALFHGDQVELIPRQPGEYTSFVVALNDSGTALVISYESHNDWEPTHLLYENGQTTLIDFGPGFTNPDLRLYMNNEGIIAGSTGLLPELGLRGFRFDPRTGETTRLDPLPTEEHAWIMGINDHGHVLGYSADFGEIGRIGVWDHDAEFKTYLVEGTPDVPMISAHLLFNDDNLIVRTAVWDPNSEDRDYIGTSYLVPEPGVLLNLADLVDNLPPEQTLTLIHDINNHGDMIGCGDQGCFLLERTGADGSAASTAADTVHTASPGVEND